MSTFLYRAMLIASLLMLLIGCSKKEDASYENNDRWCSGRDIIDTNGNVIHTCEERCEYSREPHPNAQCVPCYDHPYSTCDNGKQRNYSACAEFLGEIECEEECYNEESCLTCDSYYNVGCSAGGDVYKYDACWDAVEMIEDCRYGCENGECTSCDEDIVEQRCYDGDVVRINDCGDVLEMIEECPYGYGCEDGECCNLNKSYACDLSWETGEARWRVVWINGCEDDWQTHQWCDPIDPSDPTAASACHTDRDPPYCAPP